MIERERVKRKATQMVMMQMLVSNDHFLIFLLGKGKAVKEQHNAGEQLLSLLQLLTSIESETSFVRDMCYNFNLLETLESIRPHVYAVTG